MPRSCQKFAIAHQKLSGSSPENWTNACTAVRRILLDVADALFPPRADEFKGRQVGAEQYINRLWAHAETRITSDSLRSTVDAELNELGSRIDRIYRQANKGIHAVVSRGEAERVIMRTYLLIAVLI